MVIVITMISMACKTYVALIREIEMGLKSWLDNTSELESAVLSKYLESHKTFYTRNKVLTAKLLKQEYRYLKLCFILVLKVEIPQKLNYVPDLI